MSRYSHQGASPPQFRPVNSLLGSRPTIGPIPADLFIPFGGISLLVSLLSSQVLGLAIEWTLALIIWGCATWWILTGSRPYRFLSKFVAVPQRWSRGHVRYCSLQDLRQHRSHASGGHASGGHASGGHASGGHASGGRGSIGRGSMGRGSE